MFTGPAHQCRLAVLDSVAPAGEWIDPLTEFRDPPRECSVMPLWFWNCELKEDGIRRQIADFEAHGVYGFVIHPRVGLPKDIGWMTARMFHFYILMNEGAEAVVTRIATAASGTPRWLDPANAETSSAALDGSGRLPRARVADPLLLTESNWTSRNQGRDG